MISVTLRKLMLGRSLRQWREHAGVARENAAAELGCTEGRIRHLESGRNPPSRADVIVLCALYGVPGEDKAALLDTLADAQRSGWWQTYKLPRWLADYVALETDATTMRSVAVELIPGLLQTERYARAVNVLSRHVVDPNDVDRQVSARMQRQQRLTADHDPLEVVAVISEAALRRCAEDANVAVEQLRHLVAIGERPNVAVHVLPFSLGLHEAMAGSFNLLSFPPDTWPETGYQEYAIGGHLVDDADAVSALATMFDELRKRALPRKDSARLITQYAQDIESE